LGRPTAVSRLKAYIRKFRQVLDNAVIAYFKPKHFTICRILDLGFFIVFSGVSKGNHAAFFDRLLSKMLRGKLPYFVISRLKSNPGTQEFAR